MKSSIAKALTAVVTAVGLSATAAQALPPIAKEVKVDPQVKKATGEEQLRHGMRLILNMKDQTKLQGTLVWANEADDSLLIRTRPGALPTKVEGKNIADITRIRLTSPSGGVAPDQPEIHQVSVSNGPITQVKYFAPALSPQERARLAELEAAQNNMSHAESMYGSVVQSLRDEIQGIKSSLDYQTLSNKLLTVDMMWMAAGWFPAAVYSPFVVAPSNGAGGGGPGATASLGNLFGAQMALEKQVATARQNLLAAQSHAYYEGDQLVAVIPGPAIRPAAAPDK